MLSKSCGLAMGWLCFGGVKNRYYPHSLMYFLPMLVQINGFLTLVISRLTTAINDVLYLLSGCLYPLTTGPTTNTSLISLVYCY